MEKRNWKEYNLKLIKRGEFLVNPEFLSTWKEEIAEMNAGKVGEPYFYSRLIINIDFLGQICRRINVLRSKCFQRKSIKQRKVNKAQMESQKRIKVMIMGNWQ